MSQDNKNLGWAPFVVGFILAFSVGWIFFSKHFVVPPLYGKLQQPVSFSHKVHTETAGMTCEDCHYFRPNGVWAGIPSIEKCAECHEEPQGESKEEIKFINTYVEPRKEVPWLIYSREPKNVFFSHAAHLTIARFKCKVCHKDLGYNDKPPVYVYSKLSKYNQQYVIVMEDCMRCHKKFDVRNYCFTCHK